LLCAFGFSFFSFFSPFSPASLTHFDVVVMLMVAASFNPVDG